MAQCNAVLDHAVVPKRDILTFPFCNFLHQSIDVPDFFSEITFINYE